MDAKTQRLLLYAALIALAWYASRTGLLAGSGTVRAIDAVSGQPITPTDYYNPPTSIDTIGTVSFGGGAGGGGGAWRPQPV